MSAADNFPTDAAVVIIGGGVIGCSLAYHLAKAGVEGVLLLERKRLTCGTTWHAAGLVPRLRSTPQLTALTDYSVGLYKSLEAETGLATGFRQNGSLGVTLSAQRLEEFKRLADMGSAIGVEANILTPDECAEYAPHLNIADVIGGIFTADDGQADPANIAMALPKALVNMARC